MLTLLTLVTHSLLPRDDLLPRDYPWPTVGEMRGFRARVRTLVDQVIRERLPLADDSVIEWNHPFWTILMGIEHERIHLETSSVLIRQLSLDHLILPTATTPGTIPSIFSVVCKQGQFGQVAPDAMGADNSTTTPNSNSTTSQHHRFVTVPKGTVTLGRPGAFQNGGGAGKDQHQSAEHGRLRASVYGWDNEFGHQASTVDDFRAMDRLITNADYLAFVRARGYQRPELWSDEGWNWVQFTKTTTPKFWLITTPTSTSTMPTGNDDDRDGGQQQPQPQQPQKLLLHDPQQSQRFQLRLMLQVVDMPWDWPVEVNCLEANAYGRWYAQETGSRTRLPSEAEYQRMLTVAAKSVGESVEGTDCLYRTNALLGVSSGTPRANIGLRYYGSPSPVKSFQTGSFYSLVGNVWQWTNSVISPFDG